MIEDGFAKGKYIETTDSTLCDLKDSKIYFIVIFIDTKIVRQCDRVLISLAVFCYS